MESKDWKQTLAIGIWSGLTIVAVVLLARRANGAFGEQPHVAIACAVALVAMALALVANVLFQLTRRPTVQSAVNILAGVITLAPPIVLGVTLLSSHSALPVSFLATLFVLASVAVVVLGDRIAKSRSMTELMGATLLTGSLEAGSLLSTAASRQESGRFGQADLVNSNDKTRLVPIENDCSSVDESVSQWMTRKGSETGQDCLRGAVKVELQPGQRRANIHIPFSPPFCTAPNINCEVLKQCSVRLNVSAAHPYGARIELHRTDDSVASETVEVSFLVTATPESTRKAA